MERYCTDSQSDKDPVLVLLGLIMFDVAKMRGIVESVASNPTDSDVLLNALKSVAELATRAQVNAQTAEKVRKLRSARSQAAVAREKRKRELNRIF